MTMKKPHDVSAQRIPQAPDTSLRLGRIASALFVTLLAAGCASTNGLSTHSSLDSANRLAAQKSLADVAVSPATWPATDWWQSFGDPQLDQLMSEALAFADVTRAALSPRIDGSASSTRERFSENGLIPPPLGGSWSTVNQLP